jgi:hypothetical protein
MISIEQILALAEEAKAKRPDPAVVSESEQKLEERAPQLAKTLSIEQILKAAEQAKRATAAPKPCNAVCLDGGELVQIYCRQVIVGPSLEDLHPITQGNSGRQWTRQSIRCISESILKDFHTPDEGQVLPRQEAKRLQSIVQRRTSSLEPGTPIHDFWAQALDELDQYINGWSRPKINQALNQWRWRD